MSNSFIRSRLQSDLFAAPPSSGIIGLEIKLERTNDRPCAECGAFNVIIGPPCGPHAASLRCICCDRHRGWLPESIADFIRAGINSVGRPTEPLIIRNSSAFARFAPAMGTGSAPSSVVPAT
jgi:hypothetical protein